MTPVARICRTQGCSNLTDGTFYCHAHTKKRDGRTTRSWERFSSPVKATRPAGAKVDTEALRVDNAGVR